jgi:lipid-binding SYLF domain-containing protein
MEKRGVKRSKKISLAMIFILGLVLSQGFFLVEPSLAKTAHEINAEVDEALNLFPQYISGGKEFLHAAKGVLVIPNVIKAGLGIGGSYGEGALRMDGKTVQYYSFTAGSIGLQIGAQKTHLILVFMQGHALESFRASSGWKAGVDGSVAFIDAGAGKSLDTVNIKDPIVAFMFGQRGLMANATIEGAKFTKLVR